MNGFWIPVLGAALIAYCSGAIAQTLYKSIGPDGQVIYSDRTPTQGKVEKTLTVSSLPNTALPASTFSYVEQLRRQQAASSTLPHKSVSSGSILFTASWCGYCKQAKAYLSSKGIPYQEVDIESEAGVRAYAEAGGKKGVPLLAHGAVRVTGFSAHACDEVFAARK